jgi:CPA2 family monovalent cation:H+ antiporter-2
MPHEIALISTIAVSLAFAFVGGFIAVRLRLPPLIGYLLAGIAVGPFTLGCIAASLAQIGEFSFILAGLGMTLCLLPEEGQHLILPAALISITLNPLLFRLAAKIRP